MFPLCCQKQEEQEKRKEEERKIERFTANYGMFNIFNRLNV